MTFICSFVSTNLYRSDVATLSPRTWLNDSIIQFDYDVISTRPQWLGASSVARTHCRFIGPQLSQLIQYADETEEIVDALTACDVTASCRAIFLAVSNSREHSAVGGSHWSLLVVTETDAAHFDSANHCNDASARAIAANVSRIVGERRFRSAVTPQQRNGYDCGLYCLLLTRALSERMERIGEYTLDARNDTALQTALASLVTADAASALRKSIAENVRRALAERHDHVTQTAPMT